jgi:hypothetical protein
MSRTWIVMILLGVLLLLMTVADLSWGNEVSVLRLGLGLALIVLGIGMRARKPKPGSPQGPAG